MTYLMAFLVTLFMVVFSVLIFFFFFGGDVVRVVTIQIDWLLVLRCRFDVYYTIMKRKSTGFKFDFLR